MTVPEAFRDRMRAELGEEYEAFMVEYEKEPLHGLRVNTLKLAPGELSLTHSLEGVEWCPEGYYYDGHMGRSPESRAGLFYSQEPSAMIAAEELGVAPGERVLDLCAAPGGKSTQLAAKLKGKGLLVSNEIVPSRAAILAENLERMGARNAVVTNMPPEKMEELFQSYFDKILVDAPCSGEGMFRRDEVAAREWSMEHVRSCAARQLNILASAAKMLRGGGELVYSTCTFSREENEGVCEGFLAENPDFELISQKRLMPHTHKGEGHFAAKFRRIDGPRLDRSAESKDADASLYKAFEAESLNVRLEGRFTAFGEKLYLTPSELGALGGIKALRPGLYLGDCKKGRFEPAHALCMALKKEDFRLTAEMSDAEVDAFYRGETISCGEGKGWAAALWNGHSVGWGKMLDGRLKNHIPKYLRG